MLEVWASARQRRRDVQPRGHRGGTYPFLRAAMCVVVRDLIVFSVISDMLRGRPAVYATLSSYDEVAHHSGLERHDTLEALRKVDKQIGRIARAARYAPRPYEIVVLSDHGQTQGATFKQRNGYGLDDLVRRSVELGRCKRFSGATRTRPQSGSRSRKHGARVPRPGPTGCKKSLGEEAVVVLGSGNLGLIYLMEEPRRLTLEEIEARHPRLVPALRRASARRFRARPLCRIAGRSRWALGALATCTSTASRATIHSAPSPQTPLSTSRAPTGSSTPRTCSSTASTTRRSTRGARSRS